jgi:uncharacterized protein (DUF2336 family)
MKARQALIKDIEQAIAGRSIQSRATSLQDVTDLFVGQAANFNDEQIALFDDVISRLAAEIELSARVELARVLAPIPNAPPTIIRTLAFDDAIEVAAPVLTQSERLDDDALISTARTKSQAHLLAISRRKTIGEAITDVLLERGDNIVVLSAVRNAGAKFSDSGFTTLVHRSSTDDNIAVSLSARSEIPRHQFLKLLSVASERVRGKLEQANPQAAAEIRRVVNAVTIKTQSKSIAESFEYSKALQSVEKLVTDGPLNERHVMALAAAGKFEDTVVALAHLAHVSIAVVERALLQERTELLLSLLKSTGLSWPTVKTILQLRSQSRMMTASDVEQCLASYERLKLQTAELVVRFHSKRANAGAG